MTHDNLAITVPFAMQDRLGLLVPLTYPLLDQRTVLLNESSSIALP